MTQSTKSSIMKWIILILVSLVILTNYYVYDMMSGIKSVIQDNLGFSNSQYGLIIAFYSFPNLIMAVIGGIILDRWGIKKTGLLFVGLCVLGALLTTYATTDGFRAGDFGYGFLNSFISGYSPELKVMIMGRFLFGLGAETSIVVINKILVKWFKGKTLATAFALNVAVARIGTAAAMITSPILVKAEFGWNTALWFATILMGIGFLLFVIYTLADNKKVAGEAALAEDEKFKLSDLGKLLTNKSFLLISFLCMIFYSAVFPFNAYLPDILFNKFGYGLELSGSVSAYIMYGTIVLTPIFGILIDKYGKRATSMFFGSGIIIIAHLTLALTSLPPLLIIMLLGISFSLVPAAMWPGVALIVEEKRLGSAYGAMTSIQNIGLFIFPIMAGVILDATNPGITEQMVASSQASWDYTWTILMFAGLGIVGLLLAWMLKREDKRRNDSALEKPSI